MARRDNERRDPWLALKLIGVTAGMFAFSFSLVPLYDAFCEITGLGGRTNDTAVQVTEAPDASRTVTVEFVTTVNEAAPWSFEPVLAYRYLISPIPRTRSST